MHVYYCSHIINTLKPPCATTSHKHPLTQDTKIPSQSFLVTTSCQRLVSFMGLLLLRGKQVSVWAKSRWVRAFPRKWLIPPFDSHKQPLPISDHKLFSFWVVTLMKGLTVFVVLSVLHCTCNKLISCLCLALWSLWRWQRRIHCCLYCSQRSSWWLYQ